jgi:hypothetical protein
MARKKASSINHMELAFFSLSELKLTHLAIFVVNTQP